MNSDFKRVSDTDILCMVADKNPAAWEHLYTKYGAAMFTIVHKLANDDVIAEKIFMDAFVELHEKKILANVTNGLCILLLRYTHGFTTMQLKSYGMLPTILNSLFNYEVINLLCTTCHTIKEVALQLNSTEAAAMKKLQDEFYLLRNQKGNADTVCKANKPMELLYPDYLNNPNN